MAVQKSEEESKADVRGIQVWILDVSAIPETKQIVLFAAAKGQFESSDNLVYGLGNYLGFMKYLTILSKIVSAI